MMIDHLYISVADNDSGIAALRTLHRKKFTNIVRIMSTRLRAMITSRR